MDELLISPYLLAGFFFVVSCIYSAVGLGGGTSYTALLTIFGASYRVIPTISLTLNIIVTLLGSINYIRQGHARFKLVGAFLISSVPMAYVGGSLDLPAELFYFILLATLIPVAARIYLWPQVNLELDLDARAKLLVSLVVGALLGFVSGVVGIGGGIYLVPLILVLGLGDEKEAAATGAIFIFLNSIAGLSAHLQRNVPDWAALAPMIVAVVIGGFLGSHLGSAKFYKKTIQRLLGVVILVAIVLLTRRLL